MDGVAPKPEFKDYPRWLRDTVGLKTTAAIRSNYEIAVKQLKDQTINSAFWRAVVGKIYELDADFHARHRVFLLPRRALPNIVEKPFQSMLNKSYRQNCMRNVNWPDPPNSGWIVPTNWFSRINDPVRTTIVVTYLDGVLFFASQLEEVTRNIGVASHTDYEAREEGYYAAHFYATLSGSILDMGWKPQTVPYSFEVQVVTQFQDAIRRVSQAQLKIEGAALSVVN